MIRTLDHAIVAVADLAAAATAYATLLGRRPSWRGRHPALGTANVLFRLDNTYLELLAANGDGAVADLVRGALGERQERPFGLALGVDEVDAAVAALHGRGLRVGEAMEGSGVDDETGARRTWRSSFAEVDAARGLRLLLIRHTSPPESLPPAVLACDPAAACDGLDHAVVFTADLDAATAFWRDGLGLPVDWRRDFPERRTRNLGLAVGDAIVELISRTDKPGRPALDTLWGLAYRCRDVARAVARLRAAGIEADEPRPGLAPGTRVATLRWARTPTLLIEATPA